MVSESVSWNVPQACRNSHNALLMGLSWDASVALTKWWRYDAAVGRGRLLEIDEDRLLRGNHGKFHDGIPGSFHDEVEIAHNEPIPFKDDCTGKLVLEQCGSDPGRRRPHKNIIGAGTGEMLIVEW